MAAGVRAIVDFVDHWQTVAAGLLALGGAAWTVRSIRAQIGQADRLAKERQRRDERAAKAVLPLALSELTQYAVDCIKLLQPYVADIGPAPPVQADMAAPRIPEAVLEPMQASARAADAEVAEKIHGALGQLQIQHARLEGLIRRAKERSPPVIWKVEGSGAVMDAAELHAQCGDLFLYARNAARDPKLTYAEQLKSALFLAGMVIDDYPELAKAVGRRLSSQAENAS